MLNPGRWGFVTTSADSLAGNRFPDNLHVAPSHSPWRLTNVTP